VVRAAREAGAVATGGGHAMAAGFSLHPRQVGSFRDWLGDRFRAFGDNSEPGSDLWLDALISPSGATAALVEEVDRAGPFGAGNSEPLFAACDVRLAFADIVGQGHVRLKLQGGDGHTLSAIAFRAADMPLGQALLAARGQRIHAAGVLRANKWNGRVEAQLQVEDAAAGT
jgi:single-stranded-DNA-specific exonuclease